MRRLLFPLIIIFSVLWALPMLWVLLMSLKPNDLLRHGGADLIKPLPLTMENFSSLLKVSLTPRWLLNSLIVSLGRTGLTLILSSLAGFALARIRFKGQQVIFFFLVCGLMIPGQAVILPLHALFSSFALHNSYLGLILPGLAGPFGTLLMAQFFKAVPRELEEAAQLDNAGRFRIFFSIMLPLSRPALATLGIFTFLGTWNDFFWPLISATDTRMYTITLGLASLHGNFAQSEGLGFLMATAVFASLPMVIVYVFFQRQIIQGIAGDMTARLREKKVNQA